MSSLTNQQLRVESEQIGNELKREANEINELSARIKLLEELASKKTHLENLKLQTNAMHVRVRELESQMNITP